MAGSAIACVLVACESIIGADFGDVKEVDCAHAAPPAAPQIAPPPGDRELVFVIDTFDLGETDTGNGGKYRGIGFDLDGVCTNESQPPGCVSPPWANPDPTDGIDGRDNGIGQLVHAQTATFGSTVFASAALTAEIPQGIIAPVALFRITGYSGYTDDDQVTVEWYTPALPLSNLPPVDWSQTPVTIPVSLASVNVTAGGDGGVGYTPKFFDAHAYVSHSTLVAHFGSGPATQIINVPFPVVSAIVTGTLNGAAANLAGGTLAGIVKEGDLFRTMPEFTKTLIGSAVCKHDPYYAEIKNYYCRFIDIRSSGVADSTSPCDAISFGLTFETRPAVLGPAEDDSVPEICPPDDLTNDDCSEPPPPSDGGT